MKHKYFNTLLIIFAVFLSNLIVAQTDPERDTLSMGAGYSNDVYYSFETGQVLSVDRANWDFAFYTEAFNTAIITNGGSNVWLYTYPNGDTSNWATVDTVGLSSWKPMFNSPTDWQEGAFNRNTMSFPDYGWGVYDANNSHHIVGDSVYIIISPSSGYKKLWIIEKDPMANIYMFRFANLDGSNQQDVEYDISEYTDKRFAYYSLANGPIDREPLSSRWDILFTKFMDWVPTLEGDSSLYSVTGVLKNLDIGSNHFYPVNPDFMDWTSQPLDSLKNSIGWDWKYFSDTGFEIIDSNYYFVQDYSGEVYKLWFEWWGGSSAGDFSFYKQLVETVSVDEFTDDQESFIIFPNPATSYLSIKTNVEITGSVDIQIVDQSGRMVFQKTAQGNELWTGIQLNSLGLHGGFYFVSITNEDYNHTQKLIIR